MNRISKLNPCLLLSALLATGCLQAQEVKITDDMSPSDGVEIIKNFSIQYREDGNERVYYSYRGNGNPDIYIKPERSAEINLTHSEETWDIEPNYSFDSTRIVYSTGQSMRQMDLWVMAVEGGDNILLHSDPHTAIGAKWSPDGSKIVFSSIDRRQKISNIFVINSDGSGLKSLTKDILGTATSPSWSADGGKILFVHGKTQDGQQDIHIMAADGGQKMRLTDTEAAEAGPVFTPDGKTIVYSAQLDNLSRLFAISNAVQEPGNLGKQLTQAPGEHAYMVSFSPNGQHMIYSSGDWTHGFDMAHLPVPRIR